MRGERERLRGGVTTRGFEKPFTEEIWKKL